MIILTVFHLISHITTSEENFIFTFCLQFKTFWPESKLLQSICTVEAGLSRLVTNLVLAASVLRLPCIWQHLLFSILFLIVLTISSDEIFSCKYRAHCFDQLRFECFFNFVSNFYLNDISWNQWLVRSFLTTSQVV